MAEGEVKKKFFSGARLLISLAILVVIIIGAIYLIDTLSSGTSTPNPKTKITALSDGGKASWVGTVLLKVGLGMQGPDVYAEDLALYLAVFIILLFAFGEILSVFTFFSETTSWIIAFALAVISGAVGFTSVIAILFAGATAIGAVGIVIILVTAFLSVATLHLGIGKGLRKWRNERQMEIEGFKSQTGANRVKSAVLGLKQIEKGFADDEKAK